MSEKAGPYSAFPLNMSGVAPVGSVDPSGLAAAAGRLKGRASTKSVSLEVSSDAIALSVAVEMVVRFTCPHCYKRLRRSYGLLFEAGLDPEPIDKTTTACGFCHGEINLVLKQKTSVDF